MTKLWIILFSTILFSFTSYADELIPEIHCGAEYATPKGYCYIAYYKGEKLIKKVLIKESNFTADKVDEISSLADSSLDYPGREAKITFDDEN